jgi:hypothetical protein
VKAYLALSIGFLILLVAGASILFLNRDTDTTLSVSLKSKDDFTFESDCQPSKSLNSEFYVGVEIDYVGDNLEIGYLPLNGIWRKGDSDQCVFNATLDKPKNATSYSIRFVADDQNIDLAKEVAFQEGLDEIELFSEVGRTHKFTGTLILKDDVPLRNSDCILSWVTSGRTCGGIEATSYNTCTGDGGYGDIGGGKTVKVLSDADKELALSKLSQGKWDISNDFNKYGSNYEFKCTFTFEGEVPRVKGSYRFIIGNRGEINYSLEEMESNNWDVLFSLG